MQPQRFLAMLVVWLLSMHSPRGMGQGVLGDRLVVAVNNVPYTQRQAELYITIKECLRKTPDDSVTLIGAQNWDDALAAFTEDMAVLQEVQRLGSFSAQDQLLDKYSAQVRRKIDGSAPLREFLARLGADEAAVQRAMDMALRIAAFRHSKDRQEGNANTAPQSGQKWLNELLQRTMTRRFSRAREYETIRPLGHAPSGR